MPEAPQKITWLFFSGIAISIFRSRLRYRVWFVFFLFATTAWLAGSQPVLALTPSRVLVAYNANWTGDQDNNGVQDSKQAAEYYLLKRGIPAANCIPEFNSEVQHLTV
jgi:hypothetical protein